LGGSGIIWTVCKPFEPCCRQITTPTSHHSSFYRPDALLDARSNVCVCVFRIVTGHFGGPGREIGLVYVCMFQCVHILGASTASFSFLQAECSSCRPVNSIRALKANIFISDPQICKF